MESPQEKFARIYPTRLRNARESIRTLGKLANPYTYAGSEEDWRMIIQALRDDLRELEDAARHQVLAAERRAERARKQEGVKPTDEFSIQERRSPEQPWSAR